MISTSNSSGIGTGTSGGGINNINSGGGGGSLINNFNFQSTSMATNQNPNNTNNPNVNYSVSASGTPLSSVSGIGYSTDYHNIIPHSPTPPLQRRLAKSFSVAPSSSQQKGVVYLNFVLVFEILTFFLLDLFTNVLFFIRTKCLVLIFISFHFNYY